MIIQGKAHWAKIVGAAHPGYDKSKTEWSMDLSIDNDVVKALTAEGLKSKIRNKGDDRGNFISFKRPAVKKDGTPAKPIRVVDAKKNPWDDRKIGNGSTVNVSFVINDKEYNGKTFRVPGIIAVQVVDFIPYEGGDYEDFSEVEGSEADQESWGEDA